jgi:hypothetical protein
MSMKNGAARLVGAAKALGIDIPATPGGMELQTVTFRYKRGFRHECICHDDVYR